MMKPILFNTDMVQAILDGHKTVTRRVMKPQPVRNGSLWEFGGAGWSDTIKRIIPIPCHSLYNRAPYRPGDVLWVRETWQFIPCIDCRLWDHEICSDIPTIYEDRDSISEGCFVYRSDYPEPERICWNPSIHMSRQAARIFLQVTGVYVERLRDISKDPPGPENQVVREGFKYECDFIAGWESTIKPADRAIYGWDANPWVWVIEFKPISKEEALRDHKIQNP